LIAAIALAVAVDATLELAGCGAVTGLLRALRKPGPTAPCRTAGEFAAFFDGHGVKAAVRDAGGDRTLLVVGDIHNLYRRREVYRDFFDKLEGRVRIDRVFMEGVYAQGAPDPHLAYWLDVERIRRDRPLTQAEQDALTDRVKKEDQSGYYRLSRECPVIGLEDPESAAKAFALSRLVTHVEMLYRGGKLDSAIEGVVNRYAKQVNSPEFPVRQYPPQMGRQEHLDLIEKARDLHARFTLAARNRQFVGVIDAALRPSETGVLIVGRAHVEPPNSQKARGTILDCLAEKRISTAYLDILAARSFARRAEPAAP
jgi:hypothetical protein